MGKKTSPASNRSFYQVKIGSRTFVSRLKVTTGDYLGLKAVPKPVDGKGKSTKYGVKGTKSFQLVFKSKIAIGGVQVQRLSFPVEGSVTLKTFYAYAKSSFSSKGVAAIITPDGRQYAWDKITRSKKGLSLPTVPSLPGLPNLTLPDGALPALGGYLGGSLFGPTGGAVGTALGGYLDGYV